MTFFLKIIIFATTLWTKHFISDMAGCHLHGNHSERHVIDFQFHTMAMEFICGKFAGVNAFSARLRLS